MIDFILSEKFWLPGVYIFIGVIGYFIISNFIKKTSKISLGKQDKSRKKTIVMLLNNIIKYVIAILVILAILGIYGVDTSKIIASIGIVSVIIGLAFQDIIKDFLSGFFIIFDNQYTVGDWVEINGFKGEVIALGLTSTKIKAYTGEVKVLSNSAFNEVTNFSVYDSKLLLHINVAYNTDIEKLEKVLNNMSDEILKIEEVTGNYQLMGVDSLSDSSIDYLVTVDCKPTYQHTVKRKMLNMIEKELRNNKIEIPYNKLDVNIIK